MVTETPSYSQFLRNPPNYRRLQNQKKVHFPRSDTYNRRPQVGGREMDGAKREVAFPVSNLGRAELILASSETTRETAYPLVQSAHNTLQILVGIFVSSLAHNLSVSLEIAKRLNRSSTLS